jgi:hypothetical protein
MPPESGIEGGEIMRENEPEGDNYVTEVRLRLRAAYAATSKLRVDAFAESPLRLELGGGSTPQDVTNLQGFWEFDEAPNHKAIEVSPPFHNAYRAIVRVAEPGAVRVDARFV